MAGTFDVAVMHDYFVDRLVYVVGLRGFSGEILAKAEAGGGGLHGIRQSEIRGGNAVNLAHALAKLGLKTLLITHSEEGHLHLLKSTFQGLDAELRVKPLRAGLTVAFEEHVNVMLGDGGGAADFGPELLDSDDWESVKNSKIVCSVNWAANRRGTDLLLEIRRRVGPRGVVFFDAADFRDRLRQFRHLLRSSRKSHYFDWVSMNQEEGLAAAKLLGFGGVGLGSACTFLAKSLAVRVDLHGERESVTSDGSRAVRERVNEIRPRRLTGAGDVWDAGRIFGQLNGLGDKDSLRFANAAAKLYLAAKTPVPPTLRQVEAGLP